MILAVLGYRQNLHAHSKFLQCTSMKPASSDTAQTSFLLQDLEKQLDPRNLLYRLAQVIDWKGFEKTFASLHRKAAERKAARSLKTISGQVVRQLDAGLPAETKDRRWLETAVRVLNQKRGDGDKIYSLHEPEVYCMSKGKEHRKYEFGAKASLVVGKTNGVILGAYSLPKNDYDGHALEPTLAQVERVSGYRPAVVIGDKGFRAKRTVAQLRL